MATSNNTGNGSKLKTYGTLIAFTCMFGAFVVHRLFMEFMMIAGVGVALMGVGIFKEDK